MYDKKSIARYLYACGEQIIAGADIIETSSYQATLEGFKDFMKVDSDSGKKYIRDSVTLAKVAVDKFKALGS